MPRLKLFALVFCIAALVASGQTQTVVTKSRSNTKDNIQVVQNPNGTLKCMSGDQPCSKVQVKGLLDAAVSARDRLHEKLLTSSVAALEVAPDGSLKCTATDGKACTTAHVSQLNNAAIAMPDVKPMQGVAVGSIQNPSN